MTLLVKIGCCDVSRWQDIVAYFRTLEMLWRISRRVGYPKNTSLAIAIGAGILPHSVLVLALTSWGETTVESPKEEAEPSGEEGVLDEVAASDGQAHAEMRHKVLSIGTLLQVSGVVALFVVPSFVFSVSQSFPFGPSGAVVLIVLAIVALLALGYVGQRLREEWLCSSCRNPLRSKYVRVCPVCRATLSIVAVPAGSSLWGRLRTRFANALILFGLVYSVFGLVTLVLALAPEGRSNGRHSTAADVEVSCVMNGRGDGKCTFTNVSDSTRGVCGHVAVWGTSEHPDKKLAEGTPYSPSVGTSQQLCTGELDPRTTVQFDFFVDDVDESCAEPAFGLSDTTWHDVCEFSFVRRF